MKTYNFIINEIDLFITLIIIKSNLFIMGFIIQYSFLVYLSFLVIFINHLN